MALFRRGDHAIEAVSRTTFAAERVLERQDLQRLLRADMSPLGEDLLVVAEEFCDWSTGARRIDLLCLDRDARLVVVELKRSEDGAHMELQALRYAAMVSSMTLDKLVATYARTMGQAEVDANAAISKFLGVESLENSALTEPVRVILVSADFSPELTTSVLWLNSQGLDITCIRLVPYRLGKELLLDITQIIPLPEAEDYLVRVREQAVEQRRVTSGRAEIIRRFWSQLIARSRARTSLLANRSPTKDHWLSAGIGRAGFSLVLTLTEHAARVELWIALADQTMAAFSNLQSHSAEIERKFGATLDWQPLPDRIGSRVCTHLEGGWRSPESDWPALQEAMIDALVRLEVAFRDPVQQVVL